MPYDERLVAPMRAELTKIGFTELKTKAAVDEALQNQGTTLVVVNSVCGCAAGMARPGVAMSLNNAKRPDHLTTVFAGQDTEAVARVREHIKEFPPSSPSAALFRNGKLVWMLQRFEIEGQTAMAVANKLAAAYEKHCVPATQG
ncbi:MAG TPA: BrxA/BrxB family bacilliredoxin [bacterium]|nr:BrxA/BrxB family bacilliredoxin [bacterium]HMZ05795.1 BrxA/BrxB family bacilliredoxin [bacterium]HNB09633.1 BrxA/BrxB family bacilliredoxin [bacterium]HNC49158.1 BrxA/BrxB family bacilliredoxin [bacterium]HNE83170.1 BrxA/BrxB family bacilliredoxin [bacterium]